MELDARRLTDGTVLDADLCIIGAGPAGIALAREFLGLDIDVLLLESGGRDPDEWTQSLNDGNLVGGPYAGLRPARRRGIGGTAALWNTPVAGESGAKYVPLDPRDFEQRDHGPGWPIRYEDLVPYYERAQAVCGLGPFRYQAVDWTAGSPGPLALTGDLLDTRVYQFGSARPFTRTYPEQLRSSANVRLQLHGTACGLISGPGGRILGARIGCRNGRRHTIRAGSFVLAAGAIENARLLLVSGLGGELVGRCFMEHPRDHALTLVGATAPFREAAFYDAHVAADGTVVGGRLALQDQVVLEQGFPNASLTLLPRMRSDPLPSGLVGTISRRLRRLTAPPPRGGYGWSLVDDPERWFEGFRLVLNLEQRPHLENRVELGNEVDALGVPRAVLSWRWRSEEQAELARLRRFLSTAIEASGLGRVEVNPTLGIDPNAHHHSGTTRMSAHPPDGVVDTDGCVHGVDNLFVTGASVFPTAGFANPTLTLVALAVRLADHLKEARRPGR